MLLEIAFTLCRIAVPEECEDRRITFLPPIPVACIFAAGPELARIVPESWAVTHWRCSHLQQRGGR